jgi:hypothetical protein
MKFHKWADIKDRKKMLGKIKFALTDEQAEKATDWKTEHDKTCKNADPLKQGAIGGRFTYCFTGTSVGVVAKLRCSCGAEIDLSDYDAW